MSSFSFLPPFPIVCVWGGGGVEGGGGGVQPLKEKICSLGSTLKE